MVSAWCTSAWRGIHYEVLRPGHNPYEPQVLLSVNDGTNIGFDPTFKLRVERDGFRLVFCKRQSLDFDLFVRPSVAAYKVRGDLAKRIPPLAFSPEDFLDEWINLPWEEAKRWTLRPSKEVARTWRERLLRRSGANNWYSSSIQFVQPCGKAQRSRKWQIGLTIDSEERKDRLPKSLYFDIVRKGDSFYLGGIATERHAGCPGEDRPSPQSPFKLP